MRIRKFLFAFVAIAALGAGYVLRPRHDTLPAYRCDRLEGASAVDDCMNHVFPSREQILAYLNDATFGQPKRGDDYGLQYFGRDGRYVLLSVGGESVSWGTAFIDSGRWWLRDAVLPLQDGRKTRTVVVQEMCSLEYAWTDQPRRIDDEDPDVACEAMWDTRFNTFQEGSAPQIRTAGDVYDLLDLYRMDGHQFHVQDFSPVAPGLKIPPETLTRAAHLYKKSRPGLS
ncbi:hypothetical protein GQ56_0111630 [Burkholderia paludis]|uniref:hypothetical protein n=1 Tax=Burkholderia paludis TaxID=1506587 RepID=UPI0004DB8600|nr:hypothetical protein [Burkholderia paludis]KFG97199.1 hypothetical protein GQ56_0111630 [Burkholderia paludis]